LESSDFDSEQMKVHVNIQQQNLEKDVIFFQRNKKLSTKIHSTPSYITISLPRFPSYTH